MAKPWEGEWLYPRRMKHGRSAGFRREEPRLSTVILGLVPRTPLSAGLSVGGGRELAAPRITLLLG